MAGGGEIMKTVFVGGIAPYRMAPKDAKWFRSQILRVCNVYHGWVCRYSHRLRRIAKGETCSIHLLDPKVRWIHAR